MPLRAVNVRVAVLALLALAACKKEVRVPAGPVEWERESLPASEGVEINGIVGSGPDDVWAVGIGIYHYDGRRWTNATPPSLIGIGTALNAVSFVARDDIWAVGVNGHLAHYDGKAWEVSQLDLAHVSDKPWAKKSYFDLLGVAAWPDEVWVGQSSEFALRYDRKAWTKLPSEGPHFVIQQLWGTSSKDVWTLPAGRLGHFDGSRWQAAVELMPAVMHGADGPSPNDTWMVGWTGNSKDNHGAARHFDGKTWTTQPLPDGTPLLRRVAVTPGEAFAVGSNGAALRHDGVAWRWCPTGVTGNLDALYAAGNGEAFAGGRIGPFILHRHASSSR